MPPAIRVGLFAPLWRLVLIVQDMQPGQARVDSWAPAKFQTDLLFPWFRTALSLSHTHTHAHVHVHAHAHANAHTRTHTHTYLHAHCMHARSDAHLTIQSGSLPNCKNATAEGAHISVMHAYA